MQKETQIHEISLGLSQAYLIRARVGCVLVDTGMPGQLGRIMRLVKSLGWGALTLIYLTHAHLDHAGSAAALRDATSAPVAIHWADAQALAQGETCLGSLGSKRRLIQRFVPELEKILNYSGVQADILFEDGDDLAEYGLEARVYHTPGHTLGSSSLVVEEKVAFVGDLASNTGKPHLQRYYAEDWSLLMQSVIHMQKLGLQRVYGGHGRGFLPSKVFDELVLS